MALLIPLELQQHRSAEYPTHEEQYEHQFLSVFLFLCEYWCDSSDEVAKPSSWIPAGMV